MENEQQESKAKGSKKESVLIKGLKNLLISLFIYFFGYMNWSIAWLVILVVVDVCNSERKKRNRRRKIFFRNSADGNEQKNILENIEDLPAWVYFPDIERAEWVNKMIKQFWPHVNHYARDFITSKIEDILKAKLEKYSLKGFKFQRVILGNIPFRIGGVVVYDNVSRDEIVVDVDVSYAGDCDYKFRLKGFNGGLKNFQLYGRLRVVLRPLIKTMPFIGGLQAFFLTTPDIEFDLDGFAGIFEIPGINELLKKSILDTVSSLAVLPNKFPIKLSEAVTGAQLNTPTVAGVLRVHVIEATDLVKKDISFTGKGKSDPYTILEVGDQTSRTETIDSTVEPKWDHWCEFIVLEPNCQQMDISVWDKDPTSDEFLGRVSLGISNLKKMGQTDMWLTLEDIKHGKIHIKCTWLSLSTDYSLLELAIREVQQFGLYDMDTALLIVYIDSASSLPQIKSSTNPDPYVQLQIGKQVKSTQTIVKSTNPVWEEGFIFFVKNPESDFLALEILDAKSDNQLCSLNFSISDLSNKENLEIVEQPFRLDNSDSKIVWSLHLKIFKNDNEEYVEELVDDRRPSNSSNTSKSISQIDSIGRPSLNNSKVIEMPHPVSVSSRSSTSTSSRSKRSSKSKLSEDLPFFPKVKLSLRYSKQRQMLIVVVHSLMDLPQINQSEKNLYVKLYLLPEKTKQSKRKTNVKSSNDPVFDRSFEYLVAQAELSIRTLEVSVIEDKAMRNIILGKVMIDLGKLDILKTYTSWFELKPHLKKD